MSIPLNPAAFQEHSSITTMAEAQRWIDGFPRPELLQRTCVVYHEKTGYVGLEMSPGKSPFQPHVEFPSSLFLRHDSDS